jgi:hypothetical protein
MLTEAQFQEQVTDLARLMGYHTMHVRRTIGKGRRWTTGTSVVGWPDLSVYGHGQFFMAELKTTTGRLTWPQQQCIDQLRAAGVTVHVWTPDDWSEIEATLTAHRTASRR